MVAKYLEIAEGRATPGTLTRNLLVEVQRLTLQKSPDTESRARHQRAARRWGVVKLRSFCLGEVTMWPPYPLTQ